jgi:hypothetical protein
VTSLARCYGRPLDCFATACERAKLACVSARLKKNNRVGRGQALKLRKDPMKSGVVGSKTNEASDILPKLSTNHGMLVRVAVHGVFPHSCCPPEGLRCKLPTASV